MSEEKSILIVEDDKFIAMALQIRLVAHGYQVEVVGAMTPAIDSIAQSMPHAAVLDINLPDGSGIELMQLMHEMQSDSKVPVVIMTASNKRGLCDMALQNGAVRFLEKPFRSGDLIHALESALHPSQGQLSVTV
jgi:two-component system KDP operon response regulator KdpE